MKKKTIKLIPLPILTMFYKVIARYTSCMGRYIVLDTDNDLLLRVIELNPKSELNRIFPIDISQIGE